MKTQFDIPALPVVYANDANYKVVAGENGAPNRCFIFFSSNGLYFPNTEAEFYRTVILANRYEWENLSPSKSKFRKAIYVRDVRKTWYVDGISTDLNCVDNLFRKLKEETDGFAEVVCVGNSAGGYAATLFGILLGAERIFNISGFFEITSQINDPTNLALQYAQSEHKKFKWFDLSTLLLENKSAIYFLFPENCELDKSQARIVENVQSVRTFAFNEDSHGVCAHNFVYPFLFVKSKAELDSLFIRNRKKSWSRFDFSLETIGLGKTLLFFLVYLKRRSLKLITKWLNRQ